MLPLEYHDDKWRIVFPKSLKFYTIFKEGKRLYREANVDQDFEGVYYWIAYTQPPKHVTTPGLRYMDLIDKGK